MTFRKSRFWSLVLAYAFFFAALGIHPLPRAEATVYQVAVTPKFKAFEPGTGNPLASGKLYTYLPGTTTLVTTYKDYAGVASNVNPIILDANGECDLFYTGYLKLALHDANNVLVWTKDNIPYGRFGALVAESLSAPVIGSPSYTDNGYFADLITPRHPERYGAIGDGVTDDSVAIQALFDNNDNPIIPAGKTYIIGQAINITRSNFHLTLDGTIKYKPTVLTDIGIYFTGDNAAYLEHVYVTGHGTIDGNRDTMVGNVNRAALQFQYVHDVLVEGITVQYAGDTVCGASSAAYGIAVLNCYDIRIFNNRLIGNCYTFTTGQGRSVTVPVLPVIYGLQFVGNFVDRMSDTYDLDPLSAGENIGVAIDINTNQSVIVSNNIVKNVPWNFGGIYATVASNTPTMKLGISAVISNNHLYNIGGVAIGSDVSASDPSNLYWLIDGNHIYRVGDWGISSTGKAVISNNILHDIGYHSPATGGAGNYGIVSGVADTIITGNFFDRTDNTIAALEAGIYYLISAQSQNLVIANNIIRDAVFGIQIASAGPTFTLDNVSYSTFTKTNANVYNAVWGSGTQTATFTIVGLTAGTDYTLSFYPTVTGQVPTFTATSGTSAATIPVVVSGTKEVITFTTSGNTVVFTATNTGASTWSTYKTWLSNIPILDKSVIQGNIMDGQMFLQTPTTGDFSGLINTIITGNIASGSAYVYPAAGVNGNVVKDNIWTP